MPSKFSFFIWTAFLIIMDNLRKRGLIVMDGCFMCKKHGESIDPILLHCEVERALSDGTFCRTSLIWVMPLRVVDLLACSNGLHGCSQVDAVGKTDPLCLM